MPSTVPRPSPRRGGDAVTWIGHATALLDLGGHRVLTDPLLTSRVAHLRRRRPVDLARAASVDVVLVSHVHADHLHLRSLRRIDRRAHLVVPRGAAPLVRRLGFRRVTEVVAGDTVHHGGDDHGTGDGSALVVEVVPAVHGAGRGPHSRVRAEPVGYVAGTERHRVYFAGDTDLFDGMAALTGITVALLPIWGWGPTIGAGHLDPQRALEAVDRIRPTHAIPIHWGTFTPEDARRRTPTWLDRPAERFADLAAASPHAHRVRVLQPGETLQLQA